MGRTGMFSCAKHSSQLKTVRQIHGRAPLVRKTEQTSVSLFLSIGCWNERVIICGREMFDRNFGWEASYALAYST